MLNQNIKHKTRNRSLARRHPWPQAECNPLGAIRILPTKRQMLTPRLRLVLRIGLQNPAHWLLLPARTRRQVVLPDLV
jgi:hypothetical protein